LALEFQIDDHSGVISDEAGILFRASLQFFLRGFVVDELITFDHVQSLHVRSAELVDQNTTFQGPIWTQLPLWLSYSC
jgi:hypothetical protein